MNKLQELKDRLKILKKYKENFDYSQDEFVQMRNAYDEAESNLESDRMDVDDETNTINKLKIGTKFENVNVDDITIKQIENEINKFN